MTGNKGLIGTTLEKRLRQEGHSIVGEIDLRNGSDIININKEKIVEKPDILIHAAAHCKINESIIDPKKTFNSNVLGTYEVFEFARKNKIPKIVYFSSSRVLNNEKNPYTSSKIYGEELAKGYRDSYGLEYLILRPSTVYGPFFDRTERLTHIFIDNALKEKDLIIYGDPKTKTLDFTHVNDFVDGVILALNSGWNKEYNISGNEEYNIYNLAEKIIELAGSKSKIIKKDAEISQPQNVLLDISDIEKIGYSPKIPLEKGIAECVDFYKDYYKNIEKLSD